MDSPEIAWLEPLVLGVRIGAMLVVVMCGMAWFVRRDGTTSEAARGGLGLTALLLVWFACILQLARTGAFSPTASGTAPLIPLAALLPPVLARFVFPRVSGVVAFVEAMPAAGLIGVQVFRAVGGVFLVLLAMHRLPGVFAWPVGLGDVLVGVFALPVAWMVSHRMRGHRAAAVAWNVFGMADHLLALALGMLTSPGRIQRLALEEPNLLMGVYPLVLIPTFIVPLSLTLHGLSLWQLGRSSRR